MSASVITVMRSWPPLCHLYVDHSRQDQELEQPTSHAIQPLGVWSQWEEGLVLLWAVDLK